MRIKLVETIWCTQKPDCYGGETCDQIEPRWHCFADGDKDSDYQREPLQFDAKRFAPGTKITVSEPHCPHCGEPRSRKFPEPETGSAFDDACECGQFSWKEWEMNEYS